MTVPDGGTFVDRSNSQQRSVVRRAPPLPGTTTFTKTTAAAADVHARNTLRARERGDTSTSSSTARRSDSRTHDTARFEGPSIKRGRREFARCDTKRVRMAERGQKKNVGVTRANHVFSGGRHAGKRTSDVGADGAREKRADHRGRPAVKPSPFEAVPASRGVRTVGGLCRASPSSPSSDVDVMSDQRR